jgi:hypothetical protein
MVRSLLLAFRSLAALERSVEWCSLDTGAKEDHLLITLHCKHAVVKRFSVGLVECEPVRAVYSTEGSANTWTVQARVLQEANGNFLANQEEVTMHVGKDTFRMNNFTEECADEKKLVHTELSMHPGEFEAYSIGQPASLTFCLKELKSLIGFAEPLGLPLTASFTAGGEPLVLGCTTGAGVSCVYVLATLAEPGPGQPLPRVAATPAARPRPAVPRPRLPPPSCDISEAATPGGARGNSTQAAGGRPCAMDSLSLSAIPQPGGAGDSGPEDLLAETPPAKRKRRQMFRRCFEQTFQPSQAPGSDRVLAMDSDPDEPDEEM